MSILRSGLLATGAVLAVAAPAQAFTHLPMVTRTLAASKASTSCRGAATATSAWTAPMAGYVTTRLDARGGEWDLYLADARSRRALSQSRAFGAHEVTQAWVGAGQRLLITGCRTAGKVSRATVTIDFMDAVKPAKQVASLVRTKPLDDSTMGKLTQLGFDFNEGQHPGYTTVLIPSREKFQVFKRLGIPYRVTTANLNAADARARAAEARAAAAAVPSAVPSGRTSYRFLADYQAEMQKIVQDHPDIARAVTIGRTYQGRAIQGVELSADVNATDDGKPVFFLVGVHHAREWPAGEVPMEFMTMVANGYGKTDADGLKITDLLQKERILIVPIINVDGFVTSRGDWAGRTATGTALPDPEDETDLSDTAEAVVAGGAFAYRRKNCDAFVPSGTSVGNGAEAVDSAVFQNFPCYYELGVDPNRNYGFDWGGPGESSNPEEQTYRGSGQWSEPETQAVWHYSQTHPVTTLITVHTVAALVLRSPGLHTNGLAPDEALLKELGDKMAKVTGYVSQFGWQLYDTTGTTEDWNYGAVGTLGYTIELGEPDDHFHGSYKTGVIDQWVGKKGTKTLGGMHDALLTAADYARQERTHVVLTGSGPAGAQLELKKTFVTKASQVCTVSDPTPVDDHCLGEGDVYGQPSTADMLDYKTTVRPDGTFTWHVTQSTRPFVGYVYNKQTKQPVHVGDREFWTLTCTVSGTVVKETKNIFAERGQTLDLGNVC